MPRRLTVVISQGQSAHPDKRRLEESLVTGLLGAAGVELVVVPHLYDLAPGTTGAMCLEGISGDLIVACWLYPRAAHWTLDRQGVRGRVGRTLLAADDEDDDDDELDEGAGGAVPSTAEDDAQGTSLPGEPHGPSRPLPDRAIYCLDLRTHPGPEPYLEEIRRIVAEASIQIVSIAPGLAAPRTAAAGAATPAPGSTTAEPNSTAEPKYDVAESVPAGFIDLFGVGAATSNTEDSGSARSGSASQNGAPSAAIPAGPAGVEATPARRWYPVIDYSRCTNCMECIDFCLFGVYGVDRSQQILVEQPDNCRKGCPACSRVCPANAIMFPQHKTPGIAGSAEESAGGIKIDLSQLFGAPNAIELAAQERDVELVAVGRDAVGLSVGIPKRQADKPAAPKDDLDSLIDQLDDFA